MSNVKAVIFDWAGTTIDFGSRAPVRAMLSVFEQADVMISEALVRQFMGMGKRDHVISILNSTMGAAAWASARDRPWSDSDVDDIMAALEPAMATAAIECGDLIPGVLETVVWLRKRETKVGSTTGYTTAMMSRVIPHAAAQGYAPDVVVCSGETALGRPAPLMIWKALAELEAWPVFNCIKVDDAPLGIEAGRNAGLWTIGLAASGNETGLSLPEYQALSVAGRDAAIQRASTAFRCVGADYVVESVADVPRVIEQIETRLKNNARPGQVEMSICL